MTAVNVVVSYGISASAVYVASKTGIQITVDQQIQIIALSTSLISGAVAGVLNFLKHRGK